MKLVSDDPKAGDPLDIESWSASLELREPGIWAAANQAPIRYPSSGNRFCSGIEDRSFWFRHRNRAILTVLDRVPPDGCLVDIGGGNGYVALALQEASYSVVLLEPGPDGVREARRRGVRTIIHSTVQNAELKPGCVPSAGMFDVLEHIEDDVGILRTLKSGLRPGGRFYLTVPAYRFLWSVHDEYAQHYRRYQLRSLIRLLRTVGFEVLYATYFFAPLPLPIFIGRTLPTLLGRRKIGSPQEAEFVPQPGAKLRTLEWWLERELALLRRGVRIPVGASCMVVAEA